MNNLKHYRLASGLTRAELSTRSGVNLRSISYYENGYKDINTASALTLYKLASVLNCKIEDLLNLE